MPSALSSLLKHYEAMQNDCETKSSIGRLTIDKHTEVESQPKKIEESAETQPATPQLKEWGSVDFDAVESIISQSPTALGMRRQQDTGISVSRDQMSDKSSPTSSFSSHLSSLMSRSLERATSLYSFGGGFQFRKRAMVDGIQMQRSPSMDSLIEAGSDSMKSDKSEQFSTAVEGDSVLESRSRKEAEDAEYLRQLMKERDKRFFQRDRPNLIDKRTQEASMRGDDSVESGGTNPISK